MNLRALPVCSVFVCITLAWACQRNAYAQEVTAKEPSAPLRQNADEIPDDLYTSRFPVAQVVAPKDGVPLDIQAVTSEKHGDVYTLSGDVVIVYGDFIVHADHIEYNSETGDVVADGHLKVSGGKAHEMIQASRGTFNLKDDTGRFYDVTGSVGLRTSNEKNKETGTYFNGNPFLFQGRMVVKSAVDRFDIYDGTVTSCQLPKPDWQLAAGRFSVHGDIVSAKNSNFRLMGVPVFYLPYVTHPVEAETRQSGFMMPFIDPQVSKKGTVIGEKFYLTLGRSADLTVGLEYFSLRGWQQSATFRYKGNGLNFFNGHYSFLMDRGYHDGNGNYVNQGGQDIVASGRKDFGEHTRTAVDMEYLSSYVYREAFSESFNQAVTSDIKSQAFLTHENNGYVSSLFFDRYQGLKRVQTGEQVRIFHVPSVDFDVEERHIGNSRLVWSAENSVSVLKRVQSNFTSDINQRVDIHPKLSVPFSAAGFKLRPGFGVRETFYSHSRVATPLPGLTPVEIYSSVNRAAVEANMEFRTPVLERVFDTSSLRQWLGRSVKHTIEPYATYRFRSGVDNFNQILRFDATDVVSDTNEIEYGITQRLFLRPTKLHDCKEDETPDTPGGQCGGTRESLMWRLSQKRFFNKNFGGAIANNRRNVLENTLDFSGVAFLTAPRDLSPILSQMRLSATDKLDIEWDMNYDTDAGKFTQSNIFLNYHVGDYFGGISHARLNAPGRFQVGSTTSQTSDFSQLRFLLGYGSPSKSGFSIAANAGLDLNAKEVQYGALQTGYNWNCCGISMEYRKYELGPVRNENAYRFSFTLANIGSAGNLRHSDRLF